MSLQILDGLVRWRRSLAGAGGALEGITFGHVLEDDYKTSDRPSCLITDIKQEGDTDIPRCVKFLVTEILTCESPLSTATGSVYGTTARLKAALNGNNLDGLAKTDFFTVHVHAVRGEPVKRTRDGMQVTLRWTVIASWRP